MTEINQDVVTAMTSWLGSMGIEVPQTVEPVSDDKPSGDARINLTEVTGLPQELPKGKALAFQMAIIGDDGKVVVLKDSNSGLLEVKGLWHTKLGRGKTRTSGDGKATVSVCNRQPKRTDDIVRIMHFVVTNLVRGKDWSSEYWTALGASLWGDNDHLTAADVKALYGIVQLVDVKKANDATHPAPVTPKAPSATALKAAKKAAQKVVDAIGVPTKVAKPRTPKASGPRRRRY
tara:strand:+ start:65 stop:763 length:699 start_codon:yes stop_codon:yes gene_type:complete